MKKDTFINTGYGNRKLHNIILRSFLEFINVGGYITNE